METPVPEQDTQSEDPLSYSSSDEGSNVVSAQPDYTSTGPVYGVFLVFDFKCWNTDRLLTPVSHEASTSTQPSSGETTPIQSSILPAHIFASMIGKDYDRDWMVKHAIDAALFDTQENSFKLEDLRRHGVVKAGDKLCVTLKSHESVVVIEAEVRDGFVSVLLQYLIRLSLQILSSRSRKTNQKAWLCDIQIATPRPDFDGILHACAGPNDLIKVMEWEYGQQHGKASPIGWHGVRVRTSEGRDLGSLYAMRQAYRTWLEQQKLWAAYNNQPLPLLRPGEGGSA